MKNTLVIIFLTFVGLQFFQIDKNNPQTNKSLEIQAPKEVMDIFKKACYDCHSNKTIWPWYSNLAPMSWSMNSNVTNGRKWLNFSTWESYTQEEKEKKIKELFRAVYAAMPPDDYILFHSEAKLSKEERKLVRDWTGVMSGNKPRALENYAK